VAPDGRTLFLKGINLGNWLLPEGYMFKFKTASSPRLISTVVNQFVGEEFADHPRATFEDVRKNRPPRGEVERALADYLEGVKFRNCKVNEGYLKALGLR
jgi:hypothetical protein